MSLRFVLVGPPGSGKGTQARVLTEHFGVPAVSTDAIFRAHIHAGDELGRLADSYTSRGELVPDGATDHMVAIGLSEEDVACGFLLDDYPRSLHQVHALDDILGGLGTVLGFVLEITADNDVVVQRLLGRAADKGHKDDTEDITRHRIVLYHQTTEPLTAEYRARRILVSVDGTGDVNEVAERIGRAVASFLGSRA